MSESSPQNSGPVRATRWRSVLFFVSGMLFGLGILSGIFYFSNSSFAKSQNGIWSQTATILKDAARDMLGTRTDKPILEIELSERTRSKSSRSAAVSGVESYSARRIAPGANLTRSANKETTKTVSGGGAPNQKPPSVTQKDEKISGTNNSKKDKNAQNASASQVQAGSVTETRPGLGVSMCDFGAAKLPNHAVLINEIAWMGTIASANDEWVELRNNSGQSIDLKNWQLVNDTGKLRIIFSDSDRLPPESFYLMERKDDNTVPDVAANKIYMGVISNSGTQLKLFDSKCVLVDEVDASSGWAKLGGDNSSKNTLERNVRDFDWHTSPAPGGSPGRRNDDRVPASSFFVPAPSSSPTSSASDGLAYIYQTQPAPPPPQNQFRANVFISEIMAGSDVGSDDEFIELMNAGGLAVDLTGWSIKKKSSSGSESALVSASRLESKSIPAGKKFLIVNEGGYRGTVTPDATWAKSNTIAYTNNAVVLYDSNNNKIEEIVWAEIPKNNSYESQSGSFVVQPAPNPQNSSQ